MTYTRGFLIKFQHLRNIKQLIGEWQQKIINSIYVGDVYKYSFQTDLSKFYVFFIPFMGSLTCSGRGRGADYSELSNLQKLLSCI